MSDREVETNADREFCASVIADVESALGPRGWVHRDGDPWPEPERTAFGRYLLFGDLSRRAKWDPPTGDFVYVE